VAAVLQSWSKSKTPTSGRFTAVAFIVIFGAAAFWGFRTLFALPH